MVQGWEPGTQYNYNDVVEYQGSHYKIIQPHRSQGDWTPDVTPALWGKIPGGGQHSYGHSDQGQHQHHQEHHQEHYQTPEKHDDDHKYEQQQQQPQNTFLGINMDQSTEDKVKLGLGGTLALGAVAAIGGGAFAYHKHKEHEEEKEGFEGWLQKAQARATQFQRDGGRGPATWVLTHGKTMPPGALVVGKEHDWTLYIGRSYVDGGVQVGKASPAFKKGCVLGYGNDEHHVEDYEVLVGDMSGLRWVPTSGRLDVESLRYRPVEGGHENNGAPLYIAKASYKGVEHPGKASTSLNGAYIPYGSEEKCIKEYCVLCYN